MYAGMHFPNGPESDEIYTLPSPLLLMLASEARYHYSAARDLGKTVIWRGLPRIGSRPAEIGWRSYEKNAKEATNLWDEQPHGGTEYFVPYNELDLNYERGDNEDDFYDIEQKFRRNNTLLKGILPFLRERVGPETKILFPPWTPDHDDVENLALWKESANLYDGFVVHAYESVDKIIPRLEWYLNEFPNKPIFLGEWNGFDPAAILLALKDLSERYTQFKGATYFSWHWYNAPAYWPEHYNVDKNPNLYTLFKNRQEASVNVQWPPERPAWQQPALITECIQQAGAKSISPRALLALLLAESGLRWNSARYAYTQNNQTINLTKQAEDAISRRDDETLKVILDEITVAGSTDISFGVGQQTVRWADEGDHTQSIENVLYIRDLYFDPVYAIKVAAKKLQGYLFTYGDELEALCRYNKPFIPGNKNPNRQNYINGLASAESLLATLNTGDESMNVYTKTTSNIAGIMPSLPRGLLLHGSRSGKAGNPKATEALGTANWCLNNPDGLGWHATIGENEYYIHMKPNEWGWNAFSASDKYIAVEFAQATVSEAISDAQVDALVDYVKKYVLPVYPTLPLVLKTHSEVEASGETVQTSGKTDVFPYKDPRADELKARILAKLQPAVPFVPGNQFEFQFGFKDKALALGEAYVGAPVEPETYISPNYSLQMTEHGLMIYSKQANTVRFLPGE